MIFNKYLVALVLSAGFLDVATAQFDGNGGQGNGDQGNVDQENAVQGNENGGTPTGGNNAQIVLEPENVQTASAADGQGNAEGVKAGQTASETDTANFINFCTGKKLTNGAQVKAGSCNGIRKMSSPPYRRATYIGFSNG
ncbi:MAG: hypothetical protein Q9196_000740 [Gyalolechia fulgens]